MATLMKKHVAIAIFFLVFEVFLVIDVVYGELQKFEHPTKADGSLSVMVIGDWGRRGKYNQSRLAYQMGVTAEKKGVDFVISTGDNFYPSGLTSENDPAFAQSFSNVYTAPSLQKPWFSVLGNHDYRGNAVAQLSPILKHRDNKWVCLRSFIVNAEIAEFFFIDTTPFQDKYFINPEDHVYDWRGVLPRDKYLSTLVKDLESQLKESNAKWKIVVGHHTIKSAGIHGNTEELVSKVLPILQANNVDLYINGHDHCLEHIGSSDSSLQFLTSGGGSKAWRGSYSWADNLEEVKFYYDGQGFMTMEITPTEIHTNFYDINGKILHDFGLSKPLSSII